MKGLLGKKLGMTQIFDENKNAVPVTVIEAGPCVVVRKKELQKDGYSALVLGFGKVKEKKVKKPLRGLFLKYKLKPLKYLREFKFKDAEKYKVGDEIKVDIFKEGEYLDITGISIGKGFAGAMKRWGFHGGPKSHGSMSHRRPAAASDTESARVKKGKRGPGRMGNRRVTVQNLKIQKIDLERNLLMVKGCTPGAKNSLLLIKKAIKK